MKKTDKRIDAYIERSPVFSHAILKRLRTIVHKACPDVEETIKWGMPSFDYHGPMFSFAAFKNHCVAGFWKAQLLDDPNNYLGERKNNGGEAMGHLGRITSIQQLPPEKVIINFLHQHMKLNVEGVKVPKKIKPKSELVVSDQFKEALAKNKKALSHFEAFSVSQKREYADWINDAKTEATRNKRIATSVEWLSEGKIRNWKYLK